MSKPLMLTGLAALASATLFLSLSSGVGGLSLVVHLVQLPLMLVGFTLGLSSLSIGAMGATAMVLVASGGMAALLFLLVEAGPCLVTIRHALLWRSSGEGEERQWYPSGLVLARLTLYMLGVMLVGLWWIDMRVGDLDGAFREALAAASSQLAGDVAAEQIITKISWLAPIMPGVAAASLLVVTIVNGSLGLALAHAQGRSLRPKERYRDLVLPAWCALAWGGALLAAFLSTGDGAFYARSAALVLALPFMLVGLAVVHCMAARLPAPRLALTFFYVFVLLFSLPAVPLVAVIGLIEDRAHLRRHLT